MTQHRKSNDEFTALAKKKNKERACGSRPKCKTFIHNLLRDASLKSWGKKIIIIRVLE